VTHWINCGRKFSHPPDVPDLDAYAKSFNNWWTSIQPESRISSSGLTHNVSAAEEWTKIKKGGPNGFNTVLIALSFWLQNVKTKPQQRKCEAVMEDILWAADQMLIKCTVPSKRPHDESDSDESNSDESNSDHNKSDDGGPSNPKRVKST
jgi:hypothetical protein